MKKIIFLVLIFALGAGFYATYLKYMEHNSGEMEFYGNVDTKVVNLSFRFLGQIERIAKREGQAVKKGEELVFMESSYLNNTILNLTSQIAQQEANLAKLKKGYRSEQIDQAKASVEVARATLKSAENTYKRQSELIKKSATSQEVYINSQANYENAKANLALQNANYEQMKNGYEKEDITVQQEVINTLKIQLEKARLDLANAVIKAPYDGVLQTIYKEEGAMAAADEAIVEIAKTDKIFVRAYIDEIHLGKIALDQNMKIYSDARKEPYNGRISMISSVAEFTPKQIQTKELRADLVYRFEVEIQDADNKIKLGSPVHIKFANN